MRPDAEEVQRYLDQLADGGPVDIRHLLAATLNARAMPGVSFRPDDFKTLSGVAIMLGLQLHRVKRLRHEREKHQQARMLAILDGNPDPGVLEDPEALCLGIEIGSTPFYLASDVERWIDRTGRRAPDGSVQKRKSPGRRPNKARQIPS